jgi:hypothetical protein
MRPWFQTPEPQIKKRKEEERKKEMKRKRKERKYLKADY